MSFLAGPAADDLEAYFDARRAVYDTQVVAPPESGDERVVMRVEPVATSHMG